MKWHHKSDPKKAGYYLAAHRNEYGSESVSELWFNPTGGGRKWWRTRGYLGERSAGLAGAVEGVYAYAEMPKPPTFET